MNSRAQQKGDSLAMLSPHATKPHPTHYPTPVWPIRNITFRSSAEDAHDLLADQLLPGAMDRDLLTGLPRLALGPKTYKFFLVESLRRRLLSRHAFRQRQNLPTDSLHHTILNDRSLHSGKFRIFVICVRQSADSWRGFRPSSAGFDRTCWLQRVPPVRRCRGSGTST